MTRVGVGLQTYNIFTPVPPQNITREEFFWRTWNSIQKTGYPAELHLLTNGSTDGTDKTVRELGGLVDNGNSQIWYGLTRLIEAMGDVDLIVLSADDVEYPENWLRRLVSFVEAAPRDIVLFTMQMEPLFSWNVPRERVEYGGEEALIRDSLPGSSWVIRRTDWEEWIGPYPKMMPGEDLEICKKVLAANKRMAALDICKHIGEEHSAWGNKSYLTSRPLDREEWGLKNGNQQSQVTTARDSR